MTFSNCPSKFKYKSRWKDRTGQSFLKDVKNEMQGKFLTKIFLNIAKLCMIKIFLASDEWQVIE